MHRGFVLTAAAPAIYRPKNILIKNYIVLSKLSISFQSTNNFNYVYF